MGEVIYIKNGTGGGGGGDATAANQTTQIGLETSIVSNTVAVANQTGLQSFNLIFANITSNTTYLGNTYYGFLFINQGANNVTINGIILKPNASLSLGFNKLERCATDITVNFPSGVSSVSVILKG